MICYLPYPYGKGGRGHGTDDNRQRRLREDELELLAPDGVVETCCLVFLSHIWLFLLSHIWLFLHGFRLRSPPWSACTYPKSGANVRAAGSSSLAAPLHRWTSLD